MIIQFKSMRIFKCSSARALLIERPAARVRAADRFIGACTYANALVSGADSQLGPIRERRRIIKSSVCVRARARPLS